MLEPSQLTSTQAHLHDGLGNGVLEPQLLHRVNKALVQLGCPHQPRPLERPGLIVFHIVCYDTAQPVSTFEFGHLGQLGEIAPKAVTDSYNTRPS